MERQSSALRRLLQTESILVMPAAYDPLGGRLIEQAGFKAVYNGGFVTGGSLAVSEPMLTLDEQVRAAGLIANSISAPVVADAGAGFGEPLHTMRCVREFIHANVAGIHIEDQLYPKRAHYHKYVAHAVSLKEFTDKIRFACQARDDLDKDFLVIARSDVTRFEGIEAGVERINAAADVGADMGLVFPRNEDEMRRATQLSKVPLVYVLSRGNRDMRPLPTIAQLEAMGYRMVIDAVTSLVVSFHYMKLAMSELAKTGTLTLLSPKDCVDARQQIEDLIGLEEFYRIEEETVEDRQWGKR